MNTQTPRPLKNGVFRRTLGGQKAALLSNALLSKQEMRLLLMVNGRTPLEDLISLAPDLSDEPCVERLLRDGLIEPAESHQPDAERLTQFMCTMRALDRPHT